MGVYIGIDPGKGGGLAMVYRKPETAIAVVQSIKMPKADKEVWSWVEARNFKECKAVIEKVGGFVGAGEGEKGGGAANGSAMFRFGMSYGGLLMALTAAGIPFTEVTPQAWQSSLFLPLRRDYPKGKKGQGAWKNVLKQKAQEMFPRVKVTLHTADALLLADYCRRLHEGKLPKGGKV